MGVIESKIEIRELTKKFGKVTALNQINLKIEDNEIIGIVGNNGAGKTTLLRILLDLLKPECGEVLSKGKNIYQSKHWTDYTGAYLDESFLIDYLTISEYFDLIGRLRNMTSDSIIGSIEKYSRFMDYELRSDKYIRNLSSGNKQKVGIVGALLFYPEIVILDEPFNYLDPSSQLILVEMLRDYIKESNATIILSSHNLQYITEICHRIVVLENGYVIRETENNSHTPEELREHFAPRQMPDRLHFRQNKFIDQASPGS